MVTKSVVRNEERGEAETTKEMEKSANKQNTKTRMGRESSTLEQERRRFWAVSIG